MKFFKERGTLTQRASMNKEFVGGSIIIVASRTKMVHATFMPSFESRLYQILQGKKGMEKKKEKKNT